MKIIFTLAIFLLILNKSFSQDTLYWKAAYKLKWSDFKAKVDTTKKHGAISNTGIYFKASYTNGQLTYKVYGYFNRKRSWVRIHSQAGLQHEQGHFDIAEIYARKLKEALKNFKINPSTVNKDLQALYDKISNEKSKRNSLYDKETDFSRDKKMQELWNLNIQQELKDLGDFAQ